MPQIEVTFDIDANGILHVSAKDKATGKENKITIKASSGLTKTKSSAWCKDAEAHAEEDRKVHGTGAARNQLDALVHTVKKSLTEYGDKIEADEKVKIEAAIKEAEDASRTRSDKEAIEAKTRSAGEGLAEAGREDVRQGAGRRRWRGGRRRPRAARAVPTGGKKDDEKVVDAEFTEVKDR